MIFKVYETPAEMDDIIVISDGECITGLYFLNELTLEKAMASAVQGSDRLLEETTEWLDSYFSGAPDAVLPRYDVGKVSPFAKRVYEIMAEIPYGTTVTYGEIAARIAQERGMERMSAQAVGGAVGRNPICIMLPCHRVMGSDGKLTGYGGGLKNKEALLKHEGVL